MAKKNARSFECTECGWHSPQWMGRCRECGAWGTVVEADAPAARVTAAPVSDTRRAMPITEATTDEALHKPTGIGEFDRVLGGGLVPGEVVLLSGEPGVGKSTLLLAVAANIARTGARVLYVSAEESVGQVKLRATRTNALVPSLYLASETDLETVLGQIETTDPELVIIDSVQTIASSSTDGLAGQPSQVREVASALLRSAKTRSMPLLLVGHVTKDGSVAGPRLLEHLVDAVCHFEGEPHSTLRFIRALKNRFGPTDEVGCFDMARSGIIECPNPAELFVGKGDPTYGTCVTIAMEGRRAIPVEIQALVTRMTGSNPKRTVQGVDSARVATILGVLGNRTPALLSSDVYVSTVGGARVREPAADLAIALAIATAQTRKPLDRTVAAFGEISLAGEVRAVTAGGQRIAEARRLGYMHFLSPTDNQLMVDDALLFAGVPARDFESRQIVRPD